MPEVPTTTAADTKSDRKSRAARLLAVLMDYAAGTADSIKTHAKRTADRIGRAARRFGAAALLLLVRVLFMAFGLSSGLAVMFGAALIIPEVTPDGFAACLLLRVPALFAVVGLWAFAWCWSLRHILPARLFNYIQYGNR
jgi:hypothetical protein